MNFYPSLREALWLMVQLILWSIVLGLPLVLISSMGIHNVVLESFFTMLGYAFPFVIVIRQAYRRMHGNQASDYDFSFTGFSWALLFWLVPMTIAMGLIGEQVAYLMPGTELFESLMEDMLQPSVFTFFTIVIFAPLLEELLFRGILLEGFLKHMRPGVAIFWSALFFGAIHMIPAQAASAFIAGLFIGWLYWRTRSLWACMLVHFINNFLSYGFFLLYGDITTNDMLDSATMIQVLVAAVAILVLGIWLIQRDTEEVETSK